MEVVRLHIPAQQLTTTIAASTLPPLFITYQTDLHESVAAFRQCGVWLCKWNGLKGNIEISLTFFGLPSGRIGDID